MDKLKDLIKEIEIYIPRQEFTDLSISKSSVGWHIEHSLIAIDLIIKGLKHSNPEEYKWKFNLPRILVFNMGKIPRGKGKAPENTLPDVSFDEVSVRDKISVAKDLIKELDSLNPDNFIKHPFFGDLNLKTTKKFLFIHTKHHLDIIKDIVGNG